MFLKKETPREPPGFATKNTNKAQDWFFLPGMLFFHQFTSIHHIIAAPLQYADYLGAKS